MGKNKLRKFAELDTFKNVFQPNMEEVRADYKLKGKWNKAFFGNENPITLELGCGKGEYAVNQAIAFPERNFIGIDIKGSRMHQGAKHAITDQIENVAFIRTKVEMSKYFFSENEVSEIWLTFSDPQPRKVSKRLSSASFLEMYAGFLTQNAKIHLKTDSLLLFDYTNDLIAKNGLTLHRATEDLYAQENTDPILNVRTYYEQMAIDNSKKITYTVFSLDGKTEFVEPENEENYRGFIKAKLSS